MSNFPSCSECGAAYPSHYGTCSQVSPEMKAAFDAIAVENDERNARIAAQGRGGWGPGPTQAEREAKSAKVVRWAFDVCSKMAFNTSIERARLWHALAVDATDEELHKLWLLLK